MWSFSEGKFSYVSWWSLKVISRTVSNKHFIINLQFIWAKIISPLPSSPDPIVAIWTAVRIAIIKVRTIIVSCVVCNNKIIAPTKGWTTVVPTVCGVAIFALAYVLFKISITVVIFQWVYEGVCRILITSRPWRDKNRTQTVKGGGLNKSCICIWLRNYCQSKRQFSFMILGYF